MSRAEKITTIIFMTLIMAILPTIIYIDSNSELKVGDCFFIKGEKSRFFKVRYVLEKSYMAGRYGKPFLPKYPANQISLVSKQESIMTIDCIDKKIQNTLRLGRLLSKESTMIVEVCTGQIQFYQEV